MISIITPVYNGEKYIESCIKNVIKQNCSKVEHIIIDGKSTDKTVEIIQKYAYKYDHIRWISEKDKGQADAINKGIKLTKGEIISSLNVDDSYKPDILNLVLTLFKNFQEPTFLTGNCEVWDANGKLLSVNEPKRLKLSDILLGWRLNPYPICSCAYFYHKSLHEIIGLYKNMNIGTDLDFILRAVQKANLKYINKTLGNFNLVHSSKTFIVSPKEKAIFKVNPYSNSLFKLYKRDLFFFFRVFLPLKKSILTLLYLIKKRKKLISFLLKIDFKRDNILKILLELV